MANVEEDIQLGEVALIIGGVLVIGYALVKGLGALGDLIKSTGDSIKAGFTHLTDSFSTKAQADQTAADVKKAGGTDAQAAAARQEVLNDAAFNKPLGGILGLGGTDAQTFINALGMTVYQARKSGMNDEQIQAGLDQDISETAPQPGM